MVKVSPGDRWAWLMLDSQGSRPDFRCGQGVKHENLLGQDLDHGRGSKYRRLCSVPPCMFNNTTLITTPLPLLLLYPKDGPAILIRLAVEQPTVKC